MYKSIYIVIYKQKRPQRDWTCQGNLGPFLMQTLLTSHFHMKIKIVSLSYNIGIST